MEQVVVLGSGPAGLTAALYLARANLKPLIIAGNQPGGQLMITSEVENFPGFPDGIMGPELMVKMRTQVERFGARFIDKDATKVILSKEEDPIHTVEVDSTVFQTKAIVIATGASALWLNIPSEQRLRGKGVSACATCDGFFFRGKVVAVVGGGDTALEEALFLTKFAKKVYLIHRRDSLRGSKIMQDRVLNHQNIEIKWNSKVAEVLGDNIVSGLSIENVLDNERTQLNVDGLFIAIGHKPNTNIFKDTGLIVDDIGYIKTDHEVFTEIQGVFVAGDVADHEFRQAITAAGSGCKAAIITERYLSSSSITPSAW